MLGRGHSPGRAKRAAWPQGIIRLGWRWGGSRPGLHAIGCRRAGAPWAYCRRRQTRAKAVEVIRCPGAGRNEDGAWSPVSLSPEAGRPNEGGSNAVLGFEASYPAARGQDFKDRIGNGAGIPGRDATITGSDYPDWLKV